MRWRIRVQASPLRLATTSARSSRQANHDRITLARGLRTRDTPRASAVHSTELQTDSLRGLPLPAFDPRVLFPGAANRPSESLEVETEVLHAVSMARQAALLRDLQCMLGLLEHNNAAFKDVVFVCIDCEAFEFDHKIVTEVGVAVFDTRLVGRDLTKCSTGDWSSMMQHAHYRPVEHASCLNRKFVSGNEDGFRFGESTWISKEDGKSLLTRLFNDPTRLPEIADYSVDIPKIDRNIVLIGHGLKNDLAFLSSLGFDYEQGANIVARADTAVVAGGTKKKSVGLARLLHSLGICAINAHNAGNDAAYTLLALLIMVVKEAKVPGSVALELANAAGKLPDVPSDDTQVTYIWGGTSSAQKMQAKNSTGLAQAVPVSAIPADNVASRKRSLAAAHDDSNKNTDLKRAKVETANDAAVGSTPDRRTAVPKACKDQLINMPCFNNCEAGDRRHHQPRRKLHGVQIQLDINGNHFHGQDIDCCSILAPTQLMREQDERY